MYRLMSQCVVRALTAVVAALCLAGCGSAAPEGAAPGGPGGMPPMGVEVATLTDGDVEQASEFIGTVKSRRSVTVQPQVEGFVTRIRVSSGDRVRTGAVLMEIDAGRQEAAVATLQAQRGAREADLAYWRQQSARLKTLLDAGAVSQQEFDQADSTVKSGEAQLAALDQQIREQNVELGYHRVQAPAGGVIGDIPVRVGDRITQSSMLTTIDDNQGLEVYLQVPIQQAPDLKLGLPVRLVDDAGVTLREAAITFIAPSVDPTTQSVLAKAALDRADGLRRDQYVRARVVWRSTRGLTIPLVAVTRVNGRFFVFTAEKDGQTTIARQRAVDLGPLVGNDYIVLKGLTAGQQLIVSGVQKIGDGAPVAPTPAGTAAAATAAAAPAAK